MEYGGEDIIGVLRKHGIKPTSQRIDIARLLLKRCAHHSADDVYSLVNEGNRLNTNGNNVSKATVYNTLGLFAKKGLVREVIADPDRIFYDSNTKPHHHIYNVSTGKLTDVDAEDVKIMGLPDLPEGTELEGVDIIVRLRESRS